MPKLDLNHVAWPLLSLALSLDQKRVNGKLRFGGFRSPEARAACKDWLREIEAQPDQPGLSTRDRLMLAVVAKIVRPDLASAYEQFVESCRIDRVAEEKHDAEEAKGRQRLEAQKVERAEAQKKREAQKQAEIEAAQLAACNESLRRLQAEPEEWRRRYPPPDPWAHVKIIRELP